MTKMGFYDARTHLSEVLDEIAKGKEILITRRGRPAALMSPPPKGDHCDVPSVVEEMLAHRDREGPKLGGEISLKELINQGRRF